MPFFLKLISVALFVTTPVTSMDVLLEFSGRPDTLEVSALSFLADAFIEAYNQQGNSNKKNGNVVTAVELDTSVLASLTHEGTATQPFSMLAQVTCDGCTKGSLFKADQGSGSAGISPDTFVFRFNDMIIDSDGKLPSIESLIAVQQVEDAGCAAEEDITTLESTFEIIFDSLGDPSEQELNEVGQALLESYNFLNTVSATSRRCDKHFRKPTKLRMGKASIAVASKKPNLRRTTQIENSALTSTEGSIRRVLISKRTRLTIATVTFSCSNICPDDSTMTDDAIKRRLDKSVSVVQQQFTRFLANPNKLECMCPVDADTSGPVPMEELISTVRRTIDTLREEGKLQSVEDIIDIKEQNGDDGSIE